MKDIEGRHDRVSTTKTVSSRSLPTRSSAGQENFGNVTSRNNFIRGEIVSQSGMTPLDSLYKSAYPRYPTFPSIYETKYARDFQYIHWPAEICKREYTPPADYSKFKFAKSRYSEEFLPREPMKNKMITPVSKNRMNKPHPRMRVVQNYPDAQRWIWSAPENSASKQIERTSTTAERVRKWQRNLEPQGHRWNSR
ncbi:uncharacterized protein LOC135686393 [Rhopilema esculentum]|uniref:uncharacterized protein LOC135686393 n=1 Tax=Rhopilema esculentum TaxID=499914 RepID=UPI0031DD643A